MPLYRRHGWISAMLTGSALLLLLSPRATAAQSASVAANAHIAIAPVIGLQDVDAPVVQVRHSTLILMETDLIVAANASYQVLVLPTAGLESLAQSGIQLAVLSSSGTYVPLDGSHPVAFDNKTRGSGMRTHVVFRFASSHPISDADIAVDVQYQAVAQGGSGAISRVLATQVLAPASRLVAVGRSATANSASFRTF